MALPKLRISGFEFHIPHQVSNPLVTQPESAHGTHLKRVNFAGASPVGGTKFKGLVAELVRAPDLGSGFLLWVRIPPRLPILVELTTSSTK